MAIVHVGIDLAKNVFAVHGVDEHGESVLVRRDGLPALRDATCRCSRYRPMSLKES
jgi:hypothetical protein